MVARVDVRHVRHLDGPFPIQRADIGPLNALFSETFTDRYRRDGLVGVRVPPLNPAVWRYAIEDAGDGAMLWRDDRGAIAAFNIAHRSGVEGWMGPLAVREDCQGAGHGKTAVNAGIAWLRGAGCRVIGLETMPRTMENIGFYAGLGFVPARLTVTLTVEAEHAGRAPRLLSALPAADRADAVRECAALVSELLPGYDFTREILLTQELALGDTVLVHTGDALAGFALCHSAPLVEGRSRDELRVLKLAVRDESLFDALMPQLADLARRTGTARVALRLQGEYGAVFHRLVARAARVRWTDLRMALAGFEERLPRYGVALSNWEI
ncbi:MAG TPA: GNAT family N-acetyltransferase [Gemmatimonadaceae bacterium]|nr:GNAT family N-acetyltransferase [Gemmatimonadaceae bacterium]